MPRNCGQPITSAFCSGASRKHGQPSQLACRASPRCGAWKRIKDASCKHRCIYFLESLIFWKPYAPTRLLHSPDVFLHVFPRSADGPLVWLPKCFYGKVEDQALHKISCPTNSGQHRHRSPIAARPSNVEHQACGFWIGTSVSENNAILVLEWAVICSIVLLNFYQTCSQGCPNFHTESTNDVRVHRSALPMLDTN